MPTRFRYLLFYKPYGVLCQFRDQEGRKTLADFGPFPRDVYAVGRLDVDSEGLVFLTNDGGLKHRLLHPKFAHPRTYLAQVEHIPSSTALRTLREGVVIHGRKTRRAEIHLLPEAPRLFPRPVPIRYRKDIPTAWLTITLREGRNRQVRRMTAAVGHPTLRLLRVGIGNLSLGSLRPGEQRELTDDEIGELKRTLKVPVRDRKT